MKKNWMSVSWVSLKYHAKLSIIAVMIVFMSITLTLVQYCHLIRITDALSLLLFLALALPLLTLLYLALTPRPTYLLDFACYRPPHHLKISKEEFIDLARKSGNFSEESIGFQQRILEDSGIGDQSYMPRVVFRPDYTITLNEGREEAATVMFGAIDELLVATKVRAKDIGILVVNCGVLNTTPSLASMVINHFKLRSNVQSFNLGGMGCSAGIIAVEVAKDLLKVYPSTYALVVSMEAVSFTWYKGDDRDKLLPNCFMRMGAAALLLSSSRSHRWHAKYELKRLHRTHHHHQSEDQGNRISSCIRIAEDAKGTQGVSVNTEVVDVLLSAISQHCLKNSTIGNDFEHACVGATGKKVLNEMQAKLGLSDDQMEASRKTLERFGNTSSSSIWYELAYLESTSKIKSGHRIWQMAFGSGIKCNTLLLKALKNITNTRTPWD